MKSGRLFWGVMLVVLGLLFLLNALTDLQLSLNSVWKFWPLLFVFWGIAALTKEKYVRLTIAGLVAVLIASIVFWFFSFQWFDLDVDDLEFTAAENQEYLSEPFVEGTVRASLEISTGAGKILFGEPTQQLIEARTATSLGYYVLNASQYEETVDLDLYLQGRNKKFMFGGFKNNIKISLNPAPVWDIRFEMGAIKSDIDLSPYAVESLSIESGASSSRIRLGDRAESCRVRIQTGASSVTIEIPEAVGCSIDIEAPFSSKSFRGFNRVRSGLYETEGFDSAEKKIMIDVEAGVSRIRVNRY